MNEGELGRRFRPRDGFEPVQGPWLAWALGHIAGLDRARDDEPLGRLRPGERERVEPVFGGSHRPCCGAARLALTRDQVSTGCFEIPLQLFSREEWSNLYERVEEFDLDEIS